MGGCSSSGSTVTTPISRFMQLMPRRIESILASRNGRAADQSAMITNRHEGDLCRLEAEILESSRGRLAMCTSFQYVASGQLHYGPGPWGSDDIGKVARLANVDDISPRCALCAWGRSSVKGRDEARQRG